jgi:aminoglycoside/choline kinase family phosphotransferase
MSSDDRAQQLAQWLHAWQKSQPQWSASQGSLTMISGDASFRRYFRQSYAQGSLIAVDAPPEKEDCHPFVAIAGALHEHGLCVPQVLAWSSSKGFMLLTDLGDTLLGSELSSATVNTLYGAAMTALIDLVDCPAPSQYALPSYDRERLLNEMRLLSEWFIPQLLGVTLDAADSAQLETQFSVIADAIAEQPVGFVHRDYHSRNLMLTPDNELGIIDFQDAVIGPITYDLMSLLRDAYVVWPAEDVQRWIAQYHQQLQQAGKLAQHISLGLFAQWCDWIAVQRHLKVLGIFARLSIRDGKHAYLNDIPVVYRYALDELAPYAELAPLRQLLLRILPKYIAQNPSAAPSLESYL